MLKHGFVIKFFAIVLTVFSLAGALAGGAGIVLLEGAGLYVNSLDELQDYEYDSIARTIAQDLADLYAVKTLGDIPYLLRQNLYTDPESRNDADYWCAEIRLDGEVLEVEGSANGSRENCDFAKTYSFTPLYPIFYEPPTEEEDNADGDNKAPNEEPDDPNTSPEPTGPTGYLYRKTETMWTSGGLESYELYYYEAPEYTVTVYMQEKVLVSSRLHLLTSLYPVRYHCIGLVITGLLLFAAGIVFLLWIAGRDKDGQIRPGGLNLIPLDIYAAVAGVGVWLLSMLYDRVLIWTYNDGPHPGNLSLLAVNVLAMILLPVSFLYAFAAQLKLKDHYWCKHSVLGFLLIRLFKGLRLLYRMLRKCIRMLPVIWQWMLTALVMVLCVALAFLAAVHSGAGIVFLVIVVLLCLIVVIYGGYAFGTLLSGAQKMSRGDLGYKVSTKYMIGSFRNFAEQLNDLSETAMIAAENQLRSERTKTELITNVSHDIKTPLTSIINFVDLLRKPHAPEDGQEYLEVLARQSARMKKLIEDLMYLSRANSGNIQPELAPIDAAEAVNQALGEFSDKLEQAELTPVFQQPETPAMIMADGKLLWRILSNLLGNAVKYALPGTRLYVDILKEDTQVLLSLKNISREELLIDSEELLERFVRGDAARSAEGSGLGLNIAKSLMEVQQGQLHLQLDGDLFKVTLSFPAL